MNMKPCLSSISSDPFFYHDFAGTTESRKKQAPKYGNENRAIDRMAKIDIGHPGSRRIAENAAEATEQRGEQQVSLQTFKCVGESSGQYRPEAAEPDRSTSGFTTKGEKSQHKSQLVQAGTEQENRRDKDPLSVLPREKCCM